MEKIKNSIDDVMNSISLQDIVDNYEKIEKESGKIKLVEECE